MNLNDVISSLKSMETPNMDLKNKFRLSIEIPESLNNLFLEGINRVIRDHIDKEIIEKIISDFDKSDMIFLDLREGSNSPFLLPGGVHVNGIKDTEISLIESTLREENRENILVNNRMIFFFQINNPQFGYIEKSPGDLFDKYGKFNNHNINLHPKLDHSSNILYLYDDITIYKSIGTDISEKNIEVTCRYEFNIKNPLRLRILQDGYSEGSGELVQKRREDFIKRLDS
jgi:hypothetical protein